MMIKQLSVFIENAEGILECVTHALSKHNINIVSFSLADALEYGVLRMIVSDPELGRKVLKEEGLLAKLTDVIAVKIGQRPGTLHSVLKLFHDAGLQVKYMYTLSTTGENTSVIMQLSNLDAAITLLNSKGYEVCKESEAYTINDLN